MDWLIGGTVLGIVLIVFAAVIVLGLITLIVVRSWIKVAGPDEALIVSAKKSKDTVPPLRVATPTHDDDDAPASRQAGTVKTTVEVPPSATTVVISGRAIVKPLVQTYEIISLRSRQVLLTAIAQSSDNVTVSVEAVAMIKIGNHPTMVRLAAERFASQDSAIQDFAKDQLEGALRGVIAQQTVTELMRERKKLSDDISENLTPQLQKQGLDLDSFQIRGITDDSGYIASLGIPETERRRQEAEIATTNAERAIARQRIANEETNLIEQTQLSENEADASRRIGEAEARSEQARALVAEQQRAEVLRQQADNRQAELDAEVKRVADAEKYRRERVAEAEAIEKVKQAEAAATQQVARAEAEATARVRAAEADAAAQLREAEADAEARTRRAEADKRVALAEADARRARAEAEAHAIRIEGEARASAIREEAEALRENQQALLARQALEVMPALMEAHARGYERVGKVTIVGTAGETTAGAAFSGESAVAMASVFESLKETTGLDLAAVIQGRVTGEAAGAAAGQAIADASND